MTRSSIYARPFRPAFLIAIVFLRWTPALAASTLCSGSEDHLIFAQPELNVADGNLFVPGATRIRPPNNTFNLISWQKNPFVESGMLTPSGWDAGEKTGLFVGPKAKEHELAYRNAVGSTTAQVSRDAVGAYLNSRELPASTHKNKMMITPNIRFSDASLVFPFDISNCHLHISLDLQVPTASDGHTAGSETYVSIDLLFSAPRTNVLIFYGTTLFFNGYPNSRRHTGYDTDSQAFFVTTPIGQDDGWIEHEPNSSIKMSAPWRGWKTFSFSISKNNFEDALFALQRAYPEKRISTSPMDYGLAGFHLNAELHFRDAPAELGWSMRRAHISASQ